MAAQTMFDKIWAKHVIVPRAGGEELLSVDLKFDAQQMLVAQGNDVIANTPAEFAQLIVAAAEKWGAVGKRLGVKLD